MRFLGNIEAKTDAKGRAFLPAVFRKVLQASGEERLVMRKDVFQTCLVLYPESVWNVQMDELRYMKMANIDQNIKFVGVDNTIEIWSNDRSEPFMEPEEFSSALEEIMNNDYQQAERD